MSKKIESTHVFLRVLEREYAERFVNNGEIMFGMPIKWRDSFFKNKDKIIGDPLEGAYSVIHNNVKESVIYRKKENLYTPTICFYGISNNHFNEKVLPNGSKRQCGFVALNYFNSFGEGISKEEYEKIEKARQKVVIVINRPELFVERIIKKAVDIGFDRKDIYCYPITYIDKKVNHICNVDYPLELFFKDKEYIEQNEIRIFIYSNNGKKMKELINNRCMLNIGDISDIAHIEDLYFNDMHFEKQDNKFIYELATPKYYNFDDLKFKELILFAIKAVCYDKCSTKEELLKKVEECNKYFNERFGIRIFLKQNNLLVFQGLNEEQQKDLNYVANNIIDLIDEYFPTLHI